MAVAEASSVKRQTHGRRQQGGIADCGCLNTPSSPSASVKAVFFLFRDGRSGRAETAGRGLGWRSRTFGPTIISLSPMAGPSWTPEQDLGAQGI